MNKRSIIVIIVIIILVALGLGGYLFLKGGGVRQNGPDIPKNLADSELVVLEGEISRIFSGGLELKVVKAEIMPLPGQESEFELIKISADKNTETIRFTDSPKSAEQFQREQAEFQAQVDVWKKEGKDIASLEAPQWPISENIAFSDLIGGNKIVVRAYRDKNGAYYAKKISLSRVVPETRDSAGNDQTPDLVKLTGIIEDISEDIIKLKEISSTGLTGALKGIKITAQTEIIEKTIKSAEQFKKEQLEFNSKAAELKEKGAETDNLPAPDWFINRTLSLKNLQAGQEINVEGIIENVSDALIIAKKIERVIR